MATRVLGIDPGTVRCGVAVTNSALTMAFPRPALRRDQYLVSALRELIEVEAIATVVVGRPVALSGHETASTRRADGLFEELKLALEGVLLIQWDERLTTHQAQRSLVDAGVKAKAYREHLDSAAAVIMLQNYVEGRRVDEN